MERNIGRGSMDMGVKKYLPENDEHRKIKLKIDTSESAVLRLSRQNTKLRRAK